MTRKTPRAAVAALHLTPDAPSAAAGLLSHVLSRLTHGTLTVELPSGERVVRAAPEAGPEATLRLHRWRTLRRLATRGDIGFAESYIEGDWSTPDLVGLFAWATSNELALTPAWRGRLLGRLSDRLMHFARRNTRRGSRRNIEAHYDLGNEFYAAWLDPGMTYSSALYPSAGISLEDAQAAKLGRIAELLDARDGMDVLEIGCGWGSLAERLVQETGCRVTALTLSPAQREYAVARLTAHRTKGSTDVLLQDYRDTGGAFDRIVSIEMLEAAGEEYWPAYFQHIHDRLKPGGVAVIQVITIAEDRFADYRRRPDFIQRYIFPGGMLPTVSILSDLVASSSLRLDRVEHFGASYAQTLAHWRERFLAAWPSLVCERVGTRSFRNMWEYYLAYCEAGFRSGVLDVGLYRIVRDARG